MRSLLRKTWAFARRFGVATTATAAVEMAFIAPILVFMFAGMLDFGTGAYAKMVVTDAAQAGAAYAQLNANTQWSATKTYGAGDVAVSGTQIYVSLVANNTGNSPPTSTTDWSAGPCTSNTGCTWNTRVAAAATSAHTSGTFFNTAPVATANVYYCCISGGTVTTSSAANCAQPGNAPPSCNPTYGIYTQIVVTSTLNTLLPYNVANSLLNLNIPSSFSLQSSYLVRVQ